MLCQEVMARCSLMKAPPGGLACLAYPSPGKCEIKGEYERHEELWPINFLDLLQFCQQT